MDYRCALRYAGLFNACCWTRRTHLPAVYAGLLTPHLPFAPLRVYLRFTVGLLHPQPHILHFAHLPAREHPGCVYDVTAVTSPC